MKSKSNLAGALLVGESSSSTAPFTGKPGQKQRRIGKVTPLDAGMLPVKRNVRKESELFVTANARRVKGDRNFTDYVMPDSRALTDIIGSA